jgi:hypothetical protein
MISLIVLGSFFCLFCISPLGYRHGSSLDTAIGSRMLLTKIKTFFIKNVTADSSLKFTNIIRYISKNVGPRMAGFWSRYLKFYEYYYWILIGFVISYWINILRGKIAKQQER